MHGAHNSVVKVKKKQLVKQECIRKIEKKRKIFWIEIRLAATIAAIAVTASGNNLPLSMIHGAIALYQS